MSDLNLCIIQTDLLWEDPEANLKMLEAKINSLDTQGKIIVLPEMFTTGFSMNPAAFAETMDGTALRWMKDISLKKKCIITGSLMIKEEYEERTLRYFNRLIWMQPNGDYGYYDKRHLFTLAAENTYFTRGKNRIVLSVNGWRILPMICYDLRFPVWSRQQRLESKEAEYDVLLYVANWPEKRIYAWRSLLVARAIENQSYVVAVNRTGTDGNGLMYNGQSLIIDPLGEVILYMHDTESIANITITKSDLMSARNSFPFLPDADDFLLMNE